MQIMEANGVRDRVRFDHMTLLTSAQRLQLINAAPSTHADHVVGLDSVHAVVRVDGLGRRIVALGATAAEAVERAKPKEAPAPLEAGASARRGSRSIGRASAEKRKIDDAAFANELAEYRRAVAALGIEAPKLL